MKHLWDGTFPASKIKSIAKKYGFKKNFDLQCRLDHAVWSYLRSVKHGPLFENKLSKINIELEHAVKTGEINSSDVAAFVAIWQATNEKLAKTKPLEFQVRRACSVARRRMRTPGRPREYWKTGLWRKLGSIYFDGTGRRPHVKGFKKFRGRTFRYMNDVVAVMKKYHGISNLSANTKLAVQQINKFDKDTYK